MCSTLNCQAKFQVVNIRKYNIGNVGGVACGSKREEGEDKERGGEEVD